MLLMSLIQWWYGDGWRQRVRQIGNGVTGMVDYFSITLLLKSLFQPFRQISAGTVDGAIDAQLRAFADRMVSRLIGAAVRTIIIITGLVAITVQVLLGLLILAIWAIMPALPVVGLVMVFIGWTP